MATAMSQLLNSELQILADLIVARIGVGTRKWLSADEAATYLRCPVSRIRKLTMTGALPVHREGRRVLYDVRELDEFVCAGGAKSP